MKTFIFLTLIILTWSCCCFADPDKIIIGGLDGIDPTGPTERNRIVLALSGGGARGLASIGVIKAFEEKNIEIAAIAGTSMGGVIGGLYAAGYSPDELSTIVNEIDFKDFFSDTPKRQTMFFTQRQEFERHLLSLRFDKFQPVIPQAWTGGQNITTELTRLTSKANYRCGGDFTKLEIPYKTVATDVVNGNEIIIDKGSISEAMRATMAFPLALTGVEKDGTVLMDGGMVTPIPVEIARSITDSIDFVVAVNTSSRLQPKAKLKTPVDIAGQVTTIMTADKMAAQLEKADFVIEPELGELEGSDFDQKDRLIAIGYRAGLEASDKILAAMAKQKSTTPYMISGEETFENSEVEVSAGSLELEQSIKAELLGKGYTREGLIDELKHLVETYQLFRLEAAIEPSAIIILDAGSISLNINLQEKLKVADYQFVFQGNTIYSAEQLIGLLVDYHELLSSTEFKQGLTRVEDKYHGDGYDIAYIRSAEIDYEKKLVSISIDEAIIKSIDIEENNRTKDWLVRSYFPLKVGQPYSTKKAAEGLNNIYGTDLFEQVSIDLVPYRDGARVKIRVKERYFTQLRLGWHWDDDYKSEQFVELLDDNIRGMGLEYLLHAQYAEHRQKYFGLLKMDRIWFSYLTARITGYHNRLDRFIYDTKGAEFDIRHERRTGFEVSLGQQVKRFGTVRGAFIVEQVRNRYDQTNLTEHFDQRIVQLESVIETFDKMPFPDRGKKFQLEFRFAGKYLGGDVEYTRFFSSLEGYIPIGKYANFHPKFSAGISRSGLPVSEQFYIGGAKSFAGLRAFEYAGDKMVLLNSELRFKLPLNFFLIGRYDVGEVYSLTDQIKLRNLRHGAGIFLSCNSPIGPFELGYSVASHDNDRFYVNIGLPF